MRLIARHRRSCHTRLGATWVEVAVVLLILLTMAALLLPAQRNATEAARRVECQNNMKQLCTAVMNYASKSDNHYLPWLAVENEQGIVSNWLTDLLPMLDRAALRREWDTLTPAGRAELDISLKIFQCPKDPTSFQVDGGLSYVANSGYGNFQVDSQSGAVIEKKPHGQGSIDWDGDGEIAGFDRPVTIATGVFWPKHEADTFRSSRGYISAGDGQTNTILFAESSNAGKWNSAKTLDIAFVVGVDRIHFNGDRSIEQYLSFDKAELGPFGIAGGTIPRHTPSPSSNHQGTSIYGFADGAARQISDKIDPVIYLKLITPNGRRYGETLVGLEKY